MSRRFLFLHDAFILPRRFFFFLLQHDIIKSGCAIRSHAHVCRWSTLYRCLNTCWITASKMQLWILRLPITCRKGFRPPGVTLDTLNLNLKAIPVRFTHNLSVLANFDLSDVDVILSTDPESQDMQDFLKLALPSSCMLPSCSFKRKGSWKVAWLSKSKILQQIDVFMSKM